MFAEKVNLPPHCGNCINYAWDDNNNTCLAGVVCEYIAQEFNILVRFFVSNIFYKTHTSKKIIVVTDLQKQINKSLKSHLTIR